MQEILDKLRTDIESLKKSGIYKAERIITSPKMPRLMWDQSIFLIFVLIII